MKKLISILLTLVISTTAMFSTASAVEYGAELANQPTKTYAQTFKDVHESYWAFNYIAEMTERNVLSGYPNGKFYPENNVTRAEFAKIMVGAANLVIPDYNTYIYCDVELDEWYAPYINVATPYMTGYVTEDGNAFMPDAPALREDIAVALVKLKGYDTFAADESILSTMFTDYQSISENAKPYVAVAVERGLVSGYEDDTFRGQASITRAEAATLLWRAYQYGNDNKLAGTELFGEIEDEVPVIEPTKTPVAIATETPTAKPTLSPTEEPTKETIEEPTPTPEVEYDYYVKTIDKVSFDGYDGYNFLTHDYNEDIVYYYDPDENIIKSYDIDNDEVSEYYNCDEIYQIKDSKTISNTEPEDADYRKDFVVKEIFFDNCSNVLIVKAVPTTLSENGKEVELAADENKCIIFYIENGDLSEICYPNEDRIIHKIIASIDSGVLSLTSNHGAEILNIDDMETYDEIIVSDSHSTEIEDRLLDYIIYEDKTLYMTLPGEGEEPALYYYDFDSAKKLNTIPGVGYVGKDKFYGWYEGTVMSCGADGKLNVAIDFGNVKITDMKKFNRSSTKFIVSGDEEEVIFVYKGSLRLAYKDN